MFISKLLYDQDSKIDSRLHSNDTSTHGGYQVNDPKVSKFLHRQVLPIMIKDFFTVTSLVMWRASLKARNPEKNKVTKKRPKRDLWVSPKVTNKVVQN